MHRSPSIEQSTSSYLTLCILFPRQPPWLLPMRHLTLDPPAFCLDPRMTEPGAGSKWQGLQLVEPDPLLDLAELAVRLRVDPDPCRIW
jgi:hypothetical protein